MGGKIIIDSCMLIIVISFLSITCTLSKAQDSSSRKVPAMYVFGDSLLDVGNNNYLAVSLAKANFPHNGVDFPTGKPTGRFSNGKNAADFIAEKLGLITASPYLSVIKKSKSDKTNAMISGVSFASGGAGVFNGTDELFKQSIPLTKQVEYYSVVYKAVVQVMGSAAAQKHLSNSIFPIVIGSNDLFGYFKSDSDVSKKSTPQQYIESMLSAVSGVLKRLRDLGARKFVIVGIGAIGCTPSQRIQNKTQVCKEEVNFWARKYNDGLTSVLKAFKSEFKDINYSYFDAYSVFVDFIQNPSTYAEKLGLPSPPPYLSLSQKENNQTITTGVSFASAGSGILNSTCGTHDKAICLAQQVDYYSIIHQPLVLQLGSDGAKQQLSESICNIWTPSHRVQSKAKD